MYTAVHLGTDQEKPLSQILIRGREQQQQLQVMRSDRTGAAGVHWVSQQWDVLSKPVQEDTGLKG